MTSLPTHAAAYALLPVGAGMLTSPLPGHEHEPGSHTCHACDCCMTLLLLTQAGTAAVRPG